MRPIETLTTFPARSLPSIENLEAEVERGRVVKREHDHLVVYCYSTTAMFEAHSNGWDPVVRNARGIVFHRGTGELLSLSFEKFLNLGENESVLPAALPDEAFWVTEKMDGSMIGVFYDGDRWRAHTKGGLSGPYIEWAEARFAQQFGDIDLTSLQGLTLVFEGIYPRGHFDEGLNVVDYGDRNELVLLTAFDVAGRAELRPDAVREVAHYLEAPTPARRSLDSLADVASAADELGYDGEGFVVQFEPTGLRVKVKGEAYRRAHKFLDRSSKLAFWESMENTGRVEAGLIARIPPDFRDDFEPIRTRLETEFDRLAGRVDALASVARTKPEGRDRALWVNRTCGALAGAVFGALNGREDTVRNVVWKLIRPDGNAWSSRPDDVIMSTNPAVQSRTGPAASR